MFDIKGRTVVLNPTVLLIPELKAISDYYGEDRLAVYSFVYFMTEGDETINPYAKLPTDRKRETLLRDFPGNYRDDDPVVMDALEKIGSFESPEERLFAAAKMAVDNVAYYLNEKSSNLTDAKEAKLVVDILTKMGEVAKNLESVREIKQKAVTKKIRGDRRIAYDQK